MCELTILACSKCGHFPELLLVSEPKDYGIPGERQKAKLELRKNCDCGILEEYFKVFEDTF